MSARRLTAVSLVLVFTLTAAVLLASAVGASGEKVVYHGNTDSKIFHGPNCRYYNCNACTRAFDSREAAIEAGYRPCKVCSP